ncbi:putative GTP diphosphokinase RSH1, chloroplastic isoform X1 [Brassica napus]|uniref:putative GTP diphosphokinase RSH1, chloroplastic isoform X1 n=1 Tax=Brassica napus TaxID=3708 RepID=UPI00207ADE9E|nr:putative GTP diphosphokinase RSH1, chloroplastic isoform X1 [Brassica napus]
MASASSMSVSVECVNICNLTKGDGNVRSDCNALSCAWKAPRSLTGFLASTAHPAVCSLYLCGRSGRKSRVKSCAWQSYEYEVGFSEVTHFVNVRKILSSRSSCGGHRRCELYCLSSESSGASDDVTIETLWEDLFPAISYLSCKELEFVQKGLKLAFEAHDGQKRRSGEPFIIHPVAVARILGELELDWESIVAGLLHDTVEDTNFVTFEKIEAEFGATVRHIVEGETKVSKLGKLKCKTDTESIQDVKADDLRQMFLAMTDEVRVIIVKLADRLHNMRTLCHMPPHKQSSIAAETLQVFAPLAKLLGMYSIKSELENLSFMYVSAEDYEKVTSRIANLYKEHEKELAEANRILVKKIEDDQFLDLVTVNTDVRSVCKETYSIYKAALKSKGSIDDYNQIAQQLRIVVKPKPSAGVGPLCSPQQICYHVLGLVHEIWKPIPRTMKDYIATPKPNGYQSLHTTVIPFLYESMFRLEIQIRTEEMDLIAERGIAVYYNGRALSAELAENPIPLGRKSRGKTGCLNNTDFALRIGWLNAIREWQEEFVGNMSSREFVDTITRDLLGSRVFVFTPKGEIKNLPKGATVVDYAYLIHTEIGNKMVAAKVNGNLVSPTHVLENAEVVEILTYNALSSKSAFQRHKQWLQHAKTRSARHKIMRFLREQAAQCAAEITQDRVNDFVADSDSDVEDLTEDSRKSLQWWEKILVNVKQFQSQDKSRNATPESQNGSVWVPKVNGKHNKAIKNASLENPEFFSPGDGIAKIFPANIPAYKEVLPGLDSWRASKIDSWHHLEGHSIEWLCVVSMARKGIIAEVTTVLAAEGITVCSCVAEIDRGRGLAVMLFQIEANTESLVSVCAKVDLISGVLGWSSGCSWPRSADNAQVLEC